MIETKLIQDRRLKIVHMDWILRHTKPKLIARPISEPTLKAPARKHH